MNLRAFIIGILISTGIFLIACGIIFLLPLTPLQTANVRVFMLETGLWMLFFSFLPPLINRR